MLDSTGRSLSERTNDPEQLHSACVAIEAPVEPWDSKYLYFYEPEFSMETMLPPALILPF
jgi:hypothetical protein